MARDVVPGEPSSLRRFLPILHWLPQYRWRDWLRPDLIAALTLWMVMVPEAMAYAGIARVPAIYGLYSVPLALLMYVLFGTSRLMVVGPDSATALISGSAIAALATQSSDEFVALTALLALMVGVLYIIFGLLRTGWVANFLSEPVLKGFINGIVVVTIAGQLPKLFGVARVSGTFFEEVRALVAQVDVLSVTTAGIGLASIALLLLLQRTRRRLPAALIVVAIMTIATVVIGSDRLGIGLVGSLPTGLPALRIPSLPPVADLGALFGAALTIILLGYSETMATATAAAEVDGSTIDPNQELIAQGFVNLGSGIAGGFIAAGSLSKTSVAMYTGGKSQIAYAATSVLVVLTLLFLMPAFSNLPEATLAAIVVVAMSGLWSQRYFNHLWSFSKLEWWSGVAAFVGVLIAGITTGVLVGVVLSLLAIIYRSASPNISQLGGFPDGSYASLQRRPDAIPVPGLLIYRFEAPLVFYNSRRFRTELRRMVKAQDPPVRVVLIDAEMFSDLDSTGVETLASVQQYLARHGIEMWIARALDPVAEKMVGIGLQPDAMFRRIDEAVRVFRARHG